MCAGVVKKIFTLYSHYNTDTNQRNKSCEWVKTKILNLMRLGGMFAL